MENLNENKKYKCHLCGDNEDKIVLFKAQNMFISAENLQDVSSDRAIENYARGGGN
ncbi:hypothetical protein [Campylobacter insulaenigrae]|uniref:hypothetical protein n=1 Tax=Campylobacter insulaenigrae TaxID=260714 RepID=UPI00215252F1|nr:hypothetical protein [Campylobacter insulaenigrae]MCR6587563.1 hypothetical protein [Campylobacter insulaenigrae]